MGADGDANWWKFSIDPQRRGSKIMDGPGGLKEISPPTADGRLLLDYHTYLGLEQLLACQAPSSETPDERVFIITHQLFELVFKMMVFDLTVIAETFNQLLVIPDDQQFLGFCTTTTNEDDFWQPALTSSSRIKYSSKTLLPAFIGFLSKSESSDEPFSSFEFAKFRDYLPPASGFQTAQFRLIQRALGKGTLLSMRLFPADEYRRNYGDWRTQGLVSVVDSTILREASLIAAPPEDSKLSRAARLDGSAHRVLERLSAFSSESSDVSEIRLITKEDVEQAVGGLRRLLVAHRSQQESLGVKAADADDKDKEAELNFRRDMEDAASAENTRRQGLIKARAGAFYLHYMAPRSALSQVLNRLASSDSALHGKQEDSFISLHLKLAADRIRDLTERAKTTGAQKPLEGTGGGGVPYLGHMRNNLIQLFPGIVAYRDLEDAPALSWIS